MKYGLLGMFCLATCLSVNAEINKDDMKVMTRETEILGVRTDTEKNDDREKFEVLEINSEQNDDLAEAYDFQIRIAAELTDANKKSYLVKYVGNQPKGFDSEYIGENFWQLWVPYNDVDRPKFTAYAIQFGVNDDDGKFIILSEDYDDVKSMSELIERTTNDYSGNIVLKHTYIYDDEDDGEQEDVYRSVKNIKTVKLVD